MKPAASQGPGQEVVDLIDARDNVIGRTTRREVRSRNLLHRGIGILCWNSSGELYVHRRTEIKDLFPGMYDMFVGGMLLAGEEYADAARREIAEELGVEGRELVHLFDHLYRGTHNHARVGVYEVEWDGPIRQQESEVAWGSWMSITELEAWIEAHEFVPDGLEIWHAYRGLSIERS